MRSSGETEGGLSCSFSSRRVKQHRPVRPQWRIFAISFGSIYSPTCGRGDSRTLSRIVWRRAPSRSGSSDRSCGPRRARHAFEFVIGAAKPLSFPRWQTSPPSPSRTRTTAGPASAASTQFTARESRHLLLQAAADRKTTSDRRAQESVRFGFAAGLDDSTGPDKFSTRENDGAIFPDP